MTSLPWLDRLRTASTEKEVVQVATDYLAGLDTFELAMLPARCRPRALRCASDVSSYAFDLVGHYCDKLDASARLVQALAAFFTEASTRLSEIVTETNVREALPRRSA
ncbi:MAG TPA: hypothetical protein VLS49_17610 [Usitatibacter sp.]|nr:hypothetical protein [Usitatibacter sp.]